ncbi:hypothetical protein BYT27DRAFT_7247721 [Phlegmacium glaucopus]|nr:hypothetical protein BYT27DRAFT_7247721 [Phlegmacium glaucopus]
MLNILVIHGYVQSAATVAGNTRPLKDKLSDLATLHYVDGPPMRGNSSSPSRPWWILGDNLEHNLSASSRWDDTVKWWSEELSKNQYDGVIGLSQGSAMTALLLSMLNHPEKAPGFHAQKTQPIKFAILCSGFVSNREPHGQIYGGLPENIPTLHTVDDNDFVVPAQRTIELQKLFKNSQLVRHNEGHSIPVRGDWPNTLRQFIIQAISREQAHIPSEHQVEGETKQTDTDPPHSPFRNIYHKLTKHFGTS